MRRTTRQRGVALITALLIFALLAVLAANLTWDNGLDVRRTMTMLYHDEGVQAAYGAEDWVRSILRDDELDSTTDHLGEIWAAEFPVLPIESDTVQGAIQGGLADLQGRFNVNNLVDENGNIDVEVYEQFQRLLIALDLDPRFAALAADWIDADDNVGLPSIPDGAEDAIYTGMIPPYLAANQELSSASELMALEGMDKATFDTLAPHIAALPKPASGEPTRINVNTATAAVLQSLDASISEADALRLIADREDGGFADFQNAFQSFVTPDIVNRYLDEHSSYFQLKVVVQIATVRITYYSVLYRESGSGATVPILRSFGTV
ncbi:MAG: type II secretion system minor pseudopilin GspK [Woeseiaceae bacterium]|nr:type II secretion system minor pseudopilin GspK [Woeseiaceae bacterium]